MARSGFVLALFAFLLAGQAVAQSTTDVMQEMADKANVTRDPNAPKDKNSLLIVPIPQKNPTLGTGVTLVGAYFYNPTDEPEPWITGVGILRTSNGSKAIAAIHKMSLGQDRFRLILFGGDADINIKFYGIGPDAGERGRFIELEEKALAGAAQPEYRIAPHLYLGARIIYLDLNTSIHRESPLFPDGEIPRREFQSKMVMAGPTVHYDSKNNFLYPTKGEEVMLALSFGIPALGSDFSHKRLQMFGNIYRPLSDKTVVAGRASVCGVSKGAPFYGLCMYGLMNDLRGYEMGRYRDRATWAAQVELRQKLFWKLGAVVFAGIGGVAPSLGDLGDSKMLPSIGAGLRFQPLKDNPVNVRFDYARGKDGSAFYISVGEAF